MSVEEAESDQTSQGADVSRRAGIVLLGTLSSRVLGAVRDAVMAACFAVSMTDAFVIAFTIPNTLRVLLGEGAVAGAFVPVFSEVRQTHDLDRARRFYLNLTGAMIFVLLAATIAGVFLAPYLVHLYAHGFADDQEQFGVTVQLTQVVFPYIFLMGLAALGMGALNSLKRFAVPAFAPALLNVALIAAPFLLIPAAQSFALPAIGALAIGALIGGVLQVAAQFPALHRVQLLKLPRFDFRDPYVKKAFLLLLPLLVGLGVYQVNILVSRLFASYLPQGSLSYLYYGQRLVEIPQGMFALAIATASLPTLSDLRSRGETEQARRLFRYGLRHSLYVAIPSAVALAILAKPCVAVFFGRNEFGVTQIDETTRSLVWQAMGIWAVASVRTVVPMFMAYNDTRTPVLGALINLVVFVGLSWLLMPFMQHAGIAAAISTAAVVQLLALLALLRYRIGRLGLSEVTRSGVRVVLASAGMGVALWAITRWGEWDRGGNDPLNIVVLITSIVVGAAVYFVLTRWLKAPEAGELIAALRRRRVPRGNH